MIRKFLKLAIVFVFLVVATLFVLSFRKIPERVTYGVSFSKLHAEELGLPWQETYVAVLDDLKAKHLRLSAHWNGVEGENNKWDWNDLDYQVKEAEKRGVDVIIALGRKAPGWPECHVPGWATTIPDEAFKKELFEYMSEVVGRYKDSPNLRYFQVENEPFLRFATKHCPRADEKMFAEEVAFVKKLDPAHKVLTTDSGEFGKWYKVRRYGDVFGSSVYIYIWHDVLGAFRYPISPGFFRIKQNFFDLVRYRPTILIELSLEPWLVKPIVEVPIDLQLERMGIDKFDEIIAFSKQTGFVEQYLWGAEWWYYMKQKGHLEFWEKAKGLF